MQKVRGHTSLRNSAPTACRRAVSGTISLPYQGYFSPFPYGTSALSVICVYLALEDGPPRFQQGFSCPIVLRCLYQFDAWNSTTGLSPSSVGFPHRSSFDASNCCELQSTDKRSYNPYRATLVGLALDKFGLIPVRSPLLRESRLIYFPLGTKMFQFPRFASNDLCIQSRIIGFPHSEIFGS